MFAWIPYTFVRITIFLIAGILLGIYVPDCIPESIAQVFLGVLTTLYFVGYFFKSKFDAAFATLNMGYIALPAVFIFGYVLLLTRTSARNPEHYIHTQQPILYYQARIANYTQEKENSWKVEADIQKIKIHKGWSNVHGKVLLYFSKKDFKNPYPYGSVLLVKGQPNLLTPPANPGEFDYKRFLTFRNIYHQHFLRKEKVRYVAHKPSSKIMEYAIRVRGWATQQLYNNVGKAEFPIATALVLGITDGLDNDILHAYSATGALHVLAVSGLHVGIIYAILLLVLRPLKKINRGEWILAGISLVVLWGYAFVTGLSPSVLRAVTMFSFVAVARPWGRSTNIYNTLSVSAFCLLLYDPYMIMSVGFQLSFVAVLGIVSLQRPLYQLCIAPSWLLDKIWQITCVSVAAQIATLSLGLLYFHQFPVYFIFSNLLVIPLSFAVLVLGLAVLALSFIAPLVYVIGWVFTKCIQAMNISVLAVESLPYSLLDNLYITTPQSWFIMGIIGSCCLLLFYKRIVYLGAAFFFTLLFSAFQWVHYIQSASDDKFIIYKVNGHSAMDIIHNGTAYFLTDSVLWNDYEKTRFHIRPNRLRHYVTTIERFDGQPFIKKQNDFTLICRNNKTILLLDKKHPILPTLIVNYVVIGNNAVSIKELENIKFDELIADSSNTPYFVEHLLKEADEKNVMIHVVNNRGAYIQTL